MGRVDVSVKLVPTADVRNTADLLERQGMDVDGISLQERAVVGSLNRRVIPRLMALPQVEKVHKLGQTYARQPEGS